MKIKIQDYLSKNRVLLIVMGFCFFDFYVNAQHLVSGTVLDFNTKQPVVQANIILKPSNKGCETNSNGEFNIENVSLGHYQLVISMLGYETHYMDFELTEKTKMQSILLQPVIHSIKVIDIIGDDVERKIINNPAMEPLSLESTLTKVPREELIRQGAITLMDGMKFVPGGLTETSGRKVKQFFSIRGQTYPYLSYSLDGIVQKEFQETISLEPRLREDYYGLCYTGYIKVPCDGLYTFYTSSDDGSQLLVHDQLIVDNDGAHGNRERSGNIALSKGYHPIEARYYEGSGGASFTVSIEGPKIMKQVITKEMLYHIPVEKRR